MTLGQGYLSASQQRHLHTVQSRDEYQRNFAILITLEYGILSFRLMLKNHCKVKRIFMSTIVDALQNILCKLPAGTQRHFVRGARSRSRAASDHFQLQHGTSVTRYNLP